MIDIVDLFNTCLYIQDHLEADLSLMFLAQTVGLSRFRFHRVFKAWRGETLHDFVTRMRMERAAFELSYPIPRSSRRSIKSIALTSGYKSLSSFSHAFSSYASVSPREFRYRALQLRKPAENGGERGNPFSPFTISMGQQPPWDIAILERPASRKASGRRRRRSGEAVPDETVARFGVELLPNLLARARGERASSARAVGLSCVGVPLADWKMSCRADGDDSAPRSTIRIDGGRYAVIEGQGTLRSIYRAWRRGFDAWIAGTGECPKAGRIYVRFPRADDPAAPIALFVPLEDRADAKQRAIHEVSASRSSAAAA